MWTVALQDGQQEQPIRFGSGHNPSLVGGGTLVRAALFTASDIGGALWQS